METINERAMEIFTDAAFRDALSDDQRVIEEEGGSWSKYLWDVARSMARDEQREDDENRMTLERFLV